MCINSSSLYCSQKKVISAMSDSVRRKFSASVCTAVCARERKSMQPQICNLFVVSVLLPSFPPLQDEAADSGDIFHARCCQENEPSIHLKPVIISDSSLGQKSGGWKRPWEDWEMFWLQESSLVFFSVFIFQSRGHQCGFLLSHSVCL